MIKVVYGPKGTGKTKIIIDEANSKVAGAKGHLIFITNTKRYMYDLHRDIRVIDTNDFMVAGEEALRYGGVLLHARQDFRAERSDHLCHLQLHERRTSRFRGKIPVKAFFG